MGKENIQVYKTKQVQLNILLYEKLKWYCLQVLTFSNKIYSIYGCKAGKKKEQNKWYIFQVLWLWFHLWVGHGLQGGVLVCEGRGGGGGAGGQVVFTLVPGKTLCDLDTKLFNLVTLLSLTVSMCLRKEDMDLRISKSTINLKY